MADEIQRFEVEDEFTEFLHADPAGGWVAFRDLAKLRQQWEDELLSEKAIRALDASLGDHVFDDGDLPAIPDYERALRAALAATQKGGE